MNIQLYNDALSIWQQGPQLNEDYHSSTGFMSCSFIKDFMKCQYSAIIKYAGLGIKEGDKVHFAVGHVVEGLIFGGIKEYYNQLDKHKSVMLLKSGKKGADAKKCLLYGKSILHARNSKGERKIRDLIRNKNSIYHQVITFDLHGLKWRSEIDCLNLIKAVEIDCKTTGDAFEDRSYNTATRQYDLTFIDKWNYHLQRAIYQFGIEQVYGIKVKPHILAVSKKNYDVQLFDFSKDQDRLDYELEKIEDPCENVKEVISGESEASMCGTCPQCIKDKRLNQAIDTSVYCAEWR